MPLRKSTSLALLLPVWAPIAITQKSPNPGVIEEKMLFFAIKATIYMKTNKTMTKCHGK